MRKTMQTQLADGQGILYNLVKPHMALENLTPAQAAGVGVGAKEVDGITSGALDKSNDQ